jgi:hypothetical protein
MSNKAHHVIKTSLLLIIIALITVSGCAGSFHATNQHYVYTYSLISPAVSEDLLYKDRYIIIQFKFDESAVRFQLQNVSEAPISILWENASIGLNRRTFAVKNWATIYSFLQDPPAPVVIPPLGYVREVVIPRERISYEKDEWVEKDMFPTQDLGSSSRKNAILRFKGSRVKLILPMMIGEAETEYAFVFKVTDITPLPKNTLPPKKERPPVPKIPFPMMGASQSIMPIVITTGILGVVVYLLSQKKNPPGDL